MKGYIKALIKRPGYVPELELIENTLKALQTKVEGYIETVGLTKDITVICNEEGILLDLPWNCRINGIDFFGPVIICGTKGEEFADLSEKNISVMQALLGGDADA